MSQFALYEKNAIKLRPLRPRQQNAIDEIRKAIREGHKRIVVQAPCGFGKTLTAAHMIAGALEKGKRPIFTCPAITLVDQTLKSFEAEGIRDIGVIQAQHERTDWNATVQIASVQTLIRRALPRVDFLLLDEVHESFDGLNDRLDSEEWKDKVAIGLTATPWTRGMGLRWTKLVIAATPQELIDEGFLSPFQIYVPDHDLDRSKLKVVKGEFQEKSSSEAMTDKAIIGDVVKTWQERGPGGKTFMFCVNRAHAKEQLGAFLDSGIPFGYIDALTPPDERQRTFREMKYGEVAGIASVGCLIRGVDEDVRCIIDCQPTKSEMRHVQKWGRGLRTAEGKEFLIGLDHAGNTLALGMVTDIHHDRLDTRKPGEKGEAFKEERPAPKPKKCEKCHALIPPKGKVCPRCGERVMVFSGVETQDGELILLGSKRTGKKDEPTREVKQQWYSELLTLATERNHRDGWAAHQYRERFGVWPNQLRKEPAAAVSHKVRQFEWKRRLTWRREQQEKDKAVVA